MWSILWVVCLGDFDGGYNVVQFGVHRRCKQCYPEIITVFPCKSGTPVVNEG